MNIYLLLGSPGAGKSHYCSRNFKNVQVVSCDVIRESMFGSMRSYEIREKVLQEIKNIVSGKVALRQDVVLDTTYFNELEARSFLFGFGGSVKVHAIYIATSLRDCLERNKMRATERVVSDEMVEMLYARISPPSDGERFESITIVN